MCEGVIGSVPISQFVIMAPATIGKPKPQKPLANIDFEITQGAVKMYEVYFCLLIPIRSDEAYGDGLSRILG